MYLYVLEYSQSLDPWEFRAVFSSQGAAEQRLLATYGVMSPSSLQEYRLSRVKCDDGLWANRSVAEWGPEVSGQGAV